tara:strand:+ start:643793 stop:645019 length:1227 start_codon:yes stop_codon:yes gene_type:complete
MTKLETISDYIATIKQENNENSNLDDRTSIVNSMSDASAQELQAALQAQIASANSEYQDALQATQKKAQDAQIFITSADVIASALQTSASNELADMNAIKTSLSNLQAAEFDLSDTHTVQKLFSVEVCGIAKMNINTEAQLLSAITAAERTNTQILKDTAIAELCDNYEVISCAENKEEYIALTKSALKDVEKTALTFNVSEANLYAEAEKLEVSDDAKANGAYLRSLQTIKDTYAAIKTSSTLAASIATIDNTVSSVKAQGTLDADDVIALTLSEYGIETQCQFDAKAKYLICDADADNIYQAMTSLEAPTDRQITSDEVDRFRKTDLSTARLKAAGLSDETCAEIQEQTKNLLSTFTSMAARPDASSPKAQYYPTSAKEQENNMKTLALNVYSEMTSASIKKLAMK